MEVEDDSRRMRRKNDSDSGSDSVVVVVDRISGLPDCILGDILSLLPTKQAVATSVLSKRWNSAWLDVHNLHFSSQHLVAPPDSAQITAFISFVNRAFFLIDCSRSLNKFSLVWHACVIPFHVICWIDAAVIRSVGEITLYLGDGDLLKLPISGFNCHSLRSLQLNGITFVYDTTVAVVCLPRLETLELDGVRFTSEEAFEKLINGCPMLLYLGLTVVSGSDDDDAEEDFMYIVSSSSLRHLYMYTEDWCTLKLNAPSLEYLMLYGPISQIFVEKGFSSLVKAHFNIELDEHDSPHNSIVEAVRALEHAKFLSLSVHLMQALALATTSFSTKFKRLVKLAATTDCCSVLDFIRSSENLEVLIIYLDHWRRPSIVDPYDHSRWTAPAVVPRCLSKSLKKIRFNSYKGLKDEREMIRYMLEHGITLEVMQIDCISEKDGEKIELLQEICEFPRMSTACKVQFDVWPRKRKFQKLYSIHSPNGQ